MMADCVALQSSSSELGQASQHVNGQEQTNESNVNEPSIDIIINNVVCSYSVKCHLNLKRIAMEGTNVEYHRQHGMLNMRIRRPYTTASVWSSGKITVTGALSEQDSKTAARKFARKIQKLGFNCKFCNFRIVNVLGTCSLPFEINITAFSRGRKEASYEPELHPGVTYKLKDPKATLKIFSTGSITVTAPRVANVESAIQHIYPLVSEFNVRPRVIQPKVVRRNVNNYRRNLNHDDDDDDSELYDSSEEDFDSDGSI